MTVNELKKIATLKSAIEANLQTAEEASYCGDIEGSQQYLATAETLQKKLQVLEARLPKPAEKPFVTIGELVNLKSLEV